MKFGKSIIVAAVAALLLSGAHVAAQDLKFGYVDSQAILAKLKEAQDVQAQLKSLYQSWEQEATTMQQDIQKKQEALAAQNLVLTDKTKQERATEIQTLAIRLQQFQQEKLGPDGEFYKEQNRLLQPIIDKIQSKINEIGEQDSFDYIFDTVNANILYASKRQTNLTERILTELEKGTSTAANGSKK